MKKAMLILGALMIAGPVLAAAPVKKAPKAVLQASLMSGHIDALKQSITLTSDSSGVWTLEVQKDCESYPCAVEDVTTRTKMKVVSMMDARAGDGPLEIKFSNGMSLKERATGFGMIPPGARSKMKLPPPFTLDIKINGAEVSLTLTMSSYIHTNTYE
jgi:hypothetical protein